MLGASKKLQGINAFIKQSIKMSTCTVCHNRIPKRVKVSTDEKKASFCSEKCLEYYNKNQNLDLFLIPEEVIDHVIIPLMDAKVLHFLKCTDFKWKKRIEEYIEKSQPKFILKKRFG